MTDQRRVWLRDKDLAWTRATVISEGDRAADPRTIRVQNDDTLEEQDQLVDGAGGEGDNVKSLNLFEDDSDVRGYEHVNDLTNLAHLHEAEILESLCTRFKSDIIYTYTGPILLAVNPFKSLPGLYSEDKLGTFYSAGLLKAQNIEAPLLEPHVFAIADNAYRSLTSQKTAGSGSPTDQSILVSGESGAGKTETTKYVMRFLATVAKSEDDKTSGTGRAERVLESNPILESFGNARTNRNDNSSRFGKFIQMSFDPSGFLVGAQIATYLLEKVRLTKQGEGERNFHVFYQMCAGASDEDRAAWLLPASIEDAAYANESGVYDRRDGVQDADQFARTDEAFTKMKFSQEERHSIYSVASAVLNMGNIVLEANGGGGEGSQVATGEALSNVAKLLQVDAALLVVALTTKRITTGKETFVKPLDPVEALVTRDALAKTIFSRLFDWLVGRVNAAIATTSSTSAAATTKKAPSNHSFIGVLDIFGFEVFVHNSFEQLCINYANETLQQQFNEFIFQLEQKLYAQEKITWAFIDFPDNKPVLDLIEQRAPKPGILTMLDEQCVVPGGNDKTFANKLYEAHGGAGAGASPAKKPLGAGSNNPEDDPSVLLFASKIDKVKFNFSVRHYAGAVSYSALGFCAKNKDELREEALDLMRTSARELVIALFPETGAAGGGAQKKAGSIQSVTVGGQFKAQLAQLLQTIKATSPHYVRCLKPNDANVRDVLVRPRVVDQLRYGGVLEAVKVARAGYPTRYTLRDFVRRYFMLSQNLQQALAKRAQTFAEDDPRWVEACEAIVNGPQRLEREAQYQIGRTKVFLRKSAFEKLESGRSLVLKANAVQIQKIGRGFVHFKRYNVYLKSVLLIQRMARGFVARRRARALRRHHAAVVMQAIVRQYCKRSIYNRQRLAAIAIQSVVRGRFGRVAYEERRKYVMARTLQCFVRRAVLRRRFLRLKAGAVAVQTRWRGIAARLELKRLKEEQREVGFFKQKIEELQKRVLEQDEQLKQERALPKQQQQGGDGAASAAAAAKEEEFARVQQERDALRAQVAEAEAKTGEDVARLKLELEAQRVENEQRLAELTAGTSSSSDDGEASSALRAQLEEAQAEVARLAAAAAAAGSSAASSNDDAQVEALTRERDELKRALAAAPTASSSSSSQQVDEEEIAALKLKHEIALAELSRERDMLVEGGGSGALLGKTIAERDSIKLELSEWQLKCAEKQDQLHSEKQLSLDAQFELTRLRQDRDVQVQQVANLVSELAATRQQADHVRGERDALVAGKDGTELMTGAFEERDQANAKLLVVSAEADALRLEVASLKSEVDNQHELIESLKGSLDVAASSSADHALQAQLADAQAQRDLVAQERDSLAELLSVSAEDDGGFQRIIAEREKSMAQQRQDFELEIKKLKLERDQVDLQLRQEKKLGAKMLEEKQALLQSLNSTGAADVPATSSSPVLGDMLKLETERAKLTAELKQAERDRDEAKQQLALLKVVSHSKSTSVGSGGVGEDLDLQIAKSSLEEMTLARDLMIKEKDDLTEDNAKLRLRVEELGVLEGALKSKIAELSTAAPVKSRFFYRAPTATAPDVTAATAAAGAANGTGNADVVGPLTSRIKELEKDAAQVKKQKEELLSRTMHIMSEMASKDIEMKKQKRAIADLEDKIEAMSLLAEQTSAIKIKLARRLDSLAQENHRLLQSLEESQDQLAAMTEVSRVLNTELQRKDVTTSANASRPSSASPPPTAAAAVDE